MVSSAGWMTTFGDMVTLLLTFMVLIVSVTNLDPQTDFALPEGVVDGQAEYIILGDGILLYANQRLLAPVVELVENIDRLPQHVMFDQREIKTAIFQLDPAQAEEYERFEPLIDEGVNVTRDNRGLVITWDRSLLFSEGGATLYEDNLKLLQKMALFLNSVSLPVSLESHTNPLSEVEGGVGIEGYELSLKRSRVVMDYLVSLGLADKKFRLGAHGGSQPRTLDPELAFENSRLEIILYQPPKSDLFGR